MITIKLSFENPGKVAPSYHFDWLAALAYISVPGWAVAFNVYGHKWFLIAAGISIAAGALRASFVQQNLPPTTLPVGTPVTNGVNEPTGIVTADGIKSTTKGEPTT